MNTQRACPVTAIRLHELCRFFSLFQWISICSESKKFVVEFAWNNQKCKIYVTVAVLSLVLESWGKKKKSLEYFYWSVLLFKILSTFYSWETFPDKSSQKNSKFFNSFNQSTLYYSIFFWQPSAQLQELEVPLTCYTAPHLLWISYPFIVPLITKSVLRLYICIQ